MYVNEYNHTNQSIIRHIFVCTKKLICQAPSTMYTKLSYNILLHHSTFYDTQTIRHIPIVYYIIRVDTFLTSFDILSIFVEYVFRGTWSSNIHVSTLFDTIWHHLTQFDKLFCLFLLVFVECFWYRTGKVGCRMT